MQTNGTQAEYRWIGIDVSKTRLDVYHATAQEYKQFSNDPTGIEALLHYTLNIANAAVVCESSGGYERQMARTLDASGVRMSVVNPRPVRDIAKGLGTLAKTDALDAQMIARYGEIVEPAQTVFASEVDEELKAHITRRQQLVEMMTAEKNRRTGLMGPDRDEITEHIDWLKERIKKLDEKIEDLSESKAEWRERKAILQSPKGIGPFISASFLVMLPELGQVSGKALAALVGVAPFNRDSGSFSGRRRIWGGRAAVRSLLYLATLSAIRANPPIRAYYEHLLSKGKVKKVAIIACMRKFLLCLNAMVKRNEPWCDDKVTAVFKTT
ncbi:MAG: IS110 family transposase [Cyanobacteria bacterium P01_A01_bin.37]